MSKASNHHMKNYDDNDDEAQDYVHNYIDMDGHG